MLLRDLYEDNEKTAVIAFGRLNPPTIGHKKLVEKIKSAPGDHFLFLSHTTKPKTDPLSFDQKKHFAEAFFPGIKIGLEGIKTPIQALAFIQDQGYDNVIFVAGSDRVESFQQLFDKYNGTPDKSGKVPFEFDNIQVVSAGERDPDADGAEGMSASKMRKMAAEGNLEQFSQGVPEPSMSEELFQAVRKGMGISDTASSESVTTESDLVINRSNLVDYIRRIIVKYIENETDIDKLSQMLTTVVGKQVKTKGGKYVITKEDVLHALSRKNKRR